MTGIVRCWCGGDAYRSSAVPTMLVCRESKFHDPAPSGRRKIQRLYVAGPMSGYPENNYPAFNEASLNLRRAGYFVVNPAEYGVEQASQHGNFRVSYEDLLREDLRQMLSCDGVAVLENWWESVGARNEAMVAGLLKMPVRPATEWLAISQKSLEATAQPLPTSLPHAGTPREPRF